MGTAIADSPEKPARLLDALSLIEDRTDRIQVLIGIAERFKKVHVPERTVTRPSPQEFLVPAASPTPIHDAWRSRFRGRWWHEGAVAVGLPGLEARRSPGASA